VGVVAATGGARDDYRGFVLTIAEGSRQDFSVLQTPDTSKLPDEPPDELVYRHDTDVRDSMRSLWASRDIVFTLAERDFRAQYKQATLGVLWAILSPLAMLAIFTIIFSRSSSFNNLVNEHVPYPIFAYLGILCWTFFSQALGTGGASLLSNNQLLSKTQFPRECFPLETLLVTALNTLLSWIPLVVLFIFYYFVHGFTVKFPGVLWTIPLVVLELLFTAGVTVGVSALIVQMRDLVQVLPIVITLGMFATPVIWPFARIPVRYQLIYSFLNPLGPIIDDARRTMLVGWPPLWGPLIAGCAGTAFYCVVGYWLFKRFEVNFADIA
jgi:ABC-2 type transport system permease protein/lipopolysaccharide transport system permease protein